MHNSCLKCIAVDILPSLAMELFQLFYRHFMIYENLDCYTVVYCNFWTSIFEDTLSSIFKKKLFKGKYQSVRDWNSELPIDESDHLTTRPMLQHTSN